MKTIFYTLRHPRTAVQGAREFKSSLGMSYDSYARSEAYDFGRDLAHRVTLRRFECL